MSICLIWSYQQQKANLAYLWTENTNWPRWWSPLQKSPHSSSPCASSCEHMSRSSPTVIKCKWICPIFNVLLYTHNRQWHYQMSAKSGKNFSSAAAPVWRACRLEWLHMWSSPESWNLLTYQRGSWPPQLLRGGWLTGRNCSFASILWLPASLVQPVKDIVSKLKMK